MQLKSSYKNHIINPIPHRANTRWNHTLYCLILLFTSINYISLPSRGDITPPKALNQDEIEAQRLYKIVTTQERKNTASDLLQLSDELANLLALAEKDHVSPNGNLQLDIATSYLNGTNGEIKENKARAFIFFKEAAKRGNSKALDYLISNRSFISTISTSTIISLVEGGDKRAIEYVIKQSGENDKCRSALIAMANKGNSSAQYYLGNAYFIGEDPFPKDEIKAIELLQKSAKQGNADAQYKLGEICISSDRFKNEQEAFKWLQASAAQSHQQAINLLEELEEKERIRQTKIQSLLKRYNSTEITQGIVHACKNLMNGRRSLESSKKILIMMNSQTQEDKIAQAVALSLLSQGIGNADATGIDSLLKMNTLLKDYAIYNYEIDESFSVGVKRIKNNIYPRKSIISSGYYKIIGIEEFENHLGTLIQIPILEKIAENIEEKP